MSYKLKDKPLWHPSLWLFWLLVFPLYLLSFLPLSAKTHLGKAIGVFTIKILKHRASDTRKNLAVCFPEKSESEREQILLDAYIAVSQGFLYSLDVWWDNTQPYLERLTVIGQEHLKEAQSRGKGILLMGGHYSIIDLAIPLIGSQLSKPGYMYRPNDNPVVDQVMESGRRKHFNIQGFSKRQLTKMLHFLKNGGEVWYACDQDFRHKTKLFAPFFGIQTGCITMPSHIARKTGATVLSVSQISLPDGSFQVEFSPILENFGQDEMADAIAWNSFIEAQLRKHPSQYLWMHKRFKTRPEGAGEIYD